MSKIFMGGKAIMLDDREKNKAGEENVGKYLSSSHKNLASNIQPCISEAYRQESCGYL